MAMLFLNYFTVDPSMVHHELLFKSIHSCQISVLLHLSSSRSDYDFGNSTNNSNKPSTSKLVVNKNKYHILCMEDENFWILPKKVGLFTVGVDTKGIPSLSALAADLCNCFAARNPNDLEISKETTCKNQGVTSLNCNKTSHLDWSHHHWLRPWESWRSPHPQGRCQVPQFGFGSKSWMKWSQRWPPLPQKICLNPGSRKGWLFVVQGHWKHCH